MGFFKKLHRLSALNRFAKTTDKIFKTNLAEKLEKPILKADEIMGGKKLPAINTAAYDISQQVANANQLQQGLLERTKAASEAGGARADVIKQMGEAAMGRGPSLADVQLKAAQDRNLSQMLAMAQQQKAALPATTQRTLLLGQQAGGRELAQQAAQNRLAERGNYLTAVNQADLGLSSNISDIYNRELAAKGQKMKIAELQQAQKEKEAAQKGALWAGLGQAAGTIVGGIYGGPAGAAAGGQAGGALGGYLGSDKNMKKDIKPASSDISKFLDAVSAKQYKYKNQEEGPDHFGIIAQALEKSKVGKSMVQDTPQGKMIDKDRALAALLASQAEINKRLKKIEKA